MGTSDWHAVTNLYANSHDPTAREDIAYAPILKSFCEIRVSLTLTLSLIPAPLRRFQNNKVTTRSNMSGEKNSTEAILPVFAARNGGR
jgi:hypothetical protein